MSLGSYVLTEDTTVNVFKTYYEKKSEGSLCKIIKLSDKTTLSPKEQCWYERVNVHNENFRTRLNDYQVQYTSDLCQNIVNKLIQFQKVVLERTRTSGSSTASFHTLFHDTSWDETVGQCNLPNNAVKFSTNMFFAENINELIELFVIHPDDVISSDWSVFEPLLNEFRSAMVNSTVSGKFKEDGKYLFDPKTVDETTRVDDTLTLVYKWCKVDYPQCQYVLNLVRQKASGENKTLVDEISQCFHNCALLMVDLAKHVESVVIVDRTKVKV